MAFEHLYSVMIFAFPKLVVELLILNEANYCIYLI